MLPQWDGSLPYAWATLISLATLEGAAPAIATTPGHNGLIVFAADITSPDARRTVSERDLLLARHQLVQELPGIDGSSLVQGGEDREEEHR